MRRWIHHYVYGNGVLLVGNEMNVDAVWFRVYGLAIDEVTCEMSAIRAHPLLF